MVIEWSLALPHLNDFKKMIFQLTAEHLSIQFGVIDDQRPTEAMTQVDSFRLSSLQRRGRGAENHGMG
jgi:hypothetical protein